jgi:hypothetical protein
VFLSTQDATTWLKQNCHLDQRSHGPCGPPKMMKKRLGPAAALYGPSPFPCHPERTRISYFTTLNSATYVVLPKENHMRLTEATTLDRKSGEAEGSAVPRTVRGDVFRQSAA